MKKCNSSSLQRHKEQIDRNKSKARGQGWESQILNGYTYLIFQICSSKPKFSVCSFPTRIQPLSFHFIHDISTAKLIECRILRKKVSSLNQVRLYCEKICPLLISWSNKNNCMLQINCGYHCIEENCFPLL